MDKGYATKDPYKQPPASNALREAEPDDGFLGRLQRSVNYASSTRVRMQRLHDRLVGESKSEQKEMGEQTKMPTDFYTLIDSENQHLTHIDFLIDQLGAHLFGNEWKRD